MSASEQAEQARQLAVENARLRFLIRRLEWTPNCSECGSIAQLGHVEGCSIARELAAAGKSSSEGP